GSAGASPSQTPAKASAAQQELRPPKAGNGHHGRHPLVGQAFLQTLQRMTFQPDIPNVRLDSLTYQECDPPGPAAGSAPLTPWRKSMPSTQLMTRRRRPCIILAALS